MRFLLSSVGGGVKFHSELSRKNLNYKIGVGARSPTLPPLLYSCHTLCLIKKGVPPKNRVRDIMTECGRDYLPCVALKSNSPI
jgi:hypothetical protein